MWKVYRRTQVASFDEYTVRYNTGEGIKFERNTFVPYIDLNGALKKQTVVLFGPLYDVAALALLELASAESPCARRQRACCKRASEVQAEANHPALVRSRARRSAEAPQTK